MVSIQPSAVSRQPLATGPKLIRDTLIAPQVAWHRLWPWPLATLREWPRCANDAGK
ncbi:hypothetical protein BJP36_35665 [Moorena producens JHB]|uniref:Uncharacterized protein n=1 Tax=Moorena producens (strain JHB) TaxID=1454205 RepID=A0A9Q9STN1_MOOP1|nr:hypothetical protein [Moorena producens]WAN69431.1 hypothetical protein BJP36_35665 [Moorena producens JHB]